MGNRAMQSNIDGSRHTAVGSHALFNCIAPPDFAGNTAVGTSALFSDTIGNFNTAMGDGALFSNTTGVANVAVGLDALASNTDNGNSTAVGVSALANSTGGVNTALGINAGVNLTSGALNIYIANQGTATESNTIRIGDVQMATYIAGISGTAVVGDPVVVDANGQLGTSGSSARFKKNVQPMDEASESILALKPVTFEYKQDAKGTPQFGLIAEEVAKVNPDLVVRDRKGEIYSVRYEAVNAMLLNEFLKAHRKNHEQEPTIAQLKNDLRAMTAHQQKQIEALTAGLHKVSAEIELAKPGPQTVLNNH